VDRSLNPDLLRAALGDAAGLPTARELADLLARAEVALIRGARDVNADLIVTGWYLHSVGSALPALQLYGLERQRQAFQVAGHIFDLALDTPDASTTERLRFTFASQVANIRGGLDPNATAAYRWRRGDVPPVDPVSEDLPLQIGAALLAMDSRWLFDRLYGLRNALAVLDQAGSGVGPGGLFRARTRLAQGAAGLHRYLVYGAADALDLAQAQLEEAARDTHPAADLDARWVAFHLWQLLGHFRESSLWAVLPPGAAPSVARAFTMGRPAVTTLWPPQVDLLRRDRVPYALDPTIRRLVFSVPTSSGKTLLAQVLAADHLIRAGTGVCFVAPTRSLCREVEASFRERLRALARPAAVQFDDSQFITVGGDEAVVRVMTPERLAFLMRTDLDGVLASYGLFVFDEAHTVADRDRGWTMEWVISTLHALTQQSDHRIVAMSAALGNRAALRGWLDPADAGFHFVSDWRGPRRLHAIYTTVKDDSSAEVLPRPRPDSPERIRYQLRGRLHVRPTATGQVTSLETTEPVGTLVLRPATWTRDPASTPFYQTLAPLIGALRQGGPVLVITPTKIEASRLASAVADQAESEGPAWLVDLAVARVGAGHPVVACLRKGVAYHHASLPSELLLGIESEVGDGGLAVVVATTTLTEGVNLPVKSVVISAQGVYGPNGFEEFITGARLLNAVGRAGRAAKESEGWIVLARNAAFGVGDFQRLAPTEDEMPIASTLSIEAALQELAELEARLAAGADAALERTGRVTDGFVSFVWYLAAVAEDRETDIEAMVQQVLRQTLAWHQITAEARARYGSVARHVTSAYRRRNEETRRRWSRAGTSILTAAHLETIVAEVVDMIDARGDEALISTEEILRTVLGNGRLDRLYSLAEAAIAHPRNQRGGQGTRVLAIDHLALVLDWVGGASVQYLADTHLGAIRDPEFRLEELADLTTSAFDNFLPWVIGIIVEWVNGRLAGADADEPVLPAALPSFVRYGVASEHAVHLIRSGVASRPLATKVADEYAASPDRGDGSLREWLCSVDFAAWRARFDATPLDLRSLLEFARPRDMRLAARLLNDEEIEIPVRAVRAVEPDAEVILADVPGFPVPSPLGLWKHNAHVATVLPEHLAEVDAVLATGIPLRVSIAVEGESVVARIRLADST
jgi:hypothetical protein